MNSGLNGLPSHFSKPNNLVGQSLTLRQQWRNPTQQTAPIFLNIDNTSVSNVNQLLMDLQVDGTSIFQVAKIGQVRVGAVTTMSGVAWSLTPNGDGDGSLGVATKRWEYLRVFRDIIGLGDAARFMLGASSDVILCRGGAAATLQQGTADAATCVAQTLKVQGIVAGTTNVAGQNWTLAGSVGTGTGAGGQIILRTAPAGSTGTAQNALATGLTITAPAINMQPSVVVGNQALATDATDGFLYIPTCAGTPTGTPTAHTGRVAMVFDTTNNKFYIYDGSWLGGTTPGAFV